MVKTKGETLSQWTKTESLEMDPHTYKQLIFDTMTKMISGERIVSTLDAEIFKYTYAKRLIFFLTLYHMKQSK